MNISTPPHWTVPNEPLMGDTVRHRADGTVDYDFYRTRAAQIRTATMRRLFHRAETI